MSILILRRFRTIFSHLLFCHRITWCSVAYSKLAEETLNTKFFFSSGKSRLIAAILVASGASE